MITYSCSISIIKIEKKRTIINILFQLNNYSTYQHTRILTYNLFIQNVMITYSCSISIIKTEKKTIINILFQLNNYSMYEHTHISTYTLFIQNVMITYSCSISIIKIEKNIYYFNLTITACMSTHIY